MKKIILVLLLYSFNNLTHAQQSNKETDSLKNALEQYLKEDTIKVNLLIKLGNLLIHKAPDEAMKYTEQALRLAEKIKWAKGMAAGYRQIGTIYYNKSDYNTAMDNFYRALKTSEPLKSKLFDGSIYGNLANIYMETGDYDKALENYNKFLTIARELKQTREESIALMNMGLLFFRKQDLSNALMHFEKSLSLAEKNNDTLVITFVLSNMGAAYDEKGEYAKALSHFNKSLAYAEMIGDMRIKAQSLEGLAEAYFYLKDYDKAERYSNTAIELAKKLDLVQYQKEMFNLQSDIYLKTGRFDKALETYKSFIVMRDSILNDEKKQELARREMQFEFEKKEAVLNATHQAELKQQQTVEYAIIGGSAILLAGSFISFIFYKRRRDAIEQKHNAEFKAQVADTEMKALRAQMNPHFIFNSLNSITDYIDKHQTKTASEFTAKFARLMRMILENSEQKEIPLADDLKALELYMQLEALRMNNKFTYEIKVDETIDKENTLIPPLILQPFVENSIWHGIAKKEGRGNILIDIKKDGEMLNCIVEDNGAGMQEKAAVNGEKKSLGMKITKARIDIINKLKQSNAAVKLLSKEDGVRAEVKLPLEMSF